MPDHDRNWWVNRVPRRKVSQRHEISLANDGKSSTADVRVRTDQQPGGDDHSVSVSRYPASNRDCTHQVFAEYGEQLKKLDLPATSRVEIRQRFRANRGDQLSLDFAVFLKSMKNPDPAAAEIHAILVNVQTQAANLLFVRRSDRHSNFRHPRISSNTRESKSWAIPASGNYELRFVSFVDPNTPGAEAHLLIDSVRVAHSAGTETTRLASLSCVGRVRQ